MRTRSDANQRGERGQALVMFVLAAGVLFGFIAMTIDIGIILHQRRVLQNTADAAALAGAIELPDSPALAHDKAQEWAENNGIDTASGDELDITVNTLDNSVSVRVEREQGFIFGRVLGLVSVEVPADATARVGSPLSLSGVLPFGVLESAINYNSVPTTIKYDANNPSNGNFGPLRIDGNGAAVLEQSIKYGTQTGICALSQPACPDPTVPTQTGNIISAARDGFNYRLDNTSSACDEFSEVLTPDDSGAYRISGTCNPFLGSPDSLRLVLVPVIEDFPNGSHPTTVLYFTALFLNELPDNKCKGNSCEVTGTFVKIVVDPANDATLGDYDSVSGLKFVRLVE